MIRQEQIRHTRRPGCSIPRRTRVCTAAGTWGPETSRHGRGARSIRVRPARALPNDSSVGCSLARAGRRGRFRLRRRGPEGRSGNPAEPEASATAMGPGRERLPMPPRSALATENFYATENALLQTISGRGRAPDNRDPEIEGPGRGGDTKPDASDAQGYRADRSDTLSIILERYSFGSRTGAGGQAFLPAGAGLPGQTGMSAPPPRSSGTACNPPENRPRSFRHTESTPMTSQRKIEANRRNAAKSTGPRTEAGKKKVSLNAVKHGLTATTVVVLPHEDEEAYRHRVEAWTAELNPRGELGRYLAERAAKVSWQLDRADSYEQACLARRVRRAERESDEGGGAEAAALLKTLYETPDEAWQSGLRQAGPRMSRPSITCRPTGARPRPPNRPRPWCASSRPRPAAAAGCSASGTGCGRRSSRRRGRTPSWAGTGTRCGARSGCWACARMRSSSPPRSTGGSACWRRSTRWSRTAPAGRSC